MPKFYVLPIPLDARQAPSFCMCGTVIVIPDAAIFLIKAHCPQTLRALPSCGGDLEHYHGLFRCLVCADGIGVRLVSLCSQRAPHFPSETCAGCHVDRKSTRLNSSHIP